jgi:nicotinamide-nucleotide amidase
MAQPDDMTLEILARRLGDQLLAKGWRLVTAESCTGGWISQTVTSVPGSSDWFDRGFVTYSNASKSELLGVPEDTLDSCGAVSGETVSAMARGALRHSKADLAVAVSGVAGPGGGSAVKPVGTVYLAWTLRNADCRVERRLFSGDRKSVRRQAVEAALRGLLEASGTAGIGCAGDAG